MSNTVRVLVEYRSSDGGVTAAAETVPAHGATAGALVYALMSAVEHQWHVMGVAAELLYESWCLPSSQVEHADDDEIGKLYPLVVAAAAYLGKPPPPDWRTHAEPAP